MFGIAQRPRFADICAGEQASPDAVRYYQLLFDGWRVVWGAVNSQGHRPEIATITRNRDPRVAEWSRAAYIQVHGHYCRYRPGHNELAVRDLCQWVRQN